MPELLVRTMRCVLVRGLVPVTTAPATTAPVGSTTVPVIAPVGAWAQTRVAIVTRANAYATEQVIPNLFQVVNTSMVGSRWSKYTPFVQSRLVHTATQVGSTEAA